jgi:RNA polymerase sigma-70 factor (ECF subfamily)
MKLQYTKDFILIAEIRNGNKEAFTIIFNKYYNKILTCLLRENKISSDQAEDFVLEAFYDLHNNIYNGKYKEEGKLYNYIYTMAHRRFLKFNNKKHLICIDINKELLEEKVDDIFANEKEMFVYSKAAEHAVKELTWLCKELIYAQYTIPKTNDVDLFNEYRNQFTCLSNVKNKRNKCIEKLRTKAKSIIEKEITL